jgi:hypothetical protein
MECDATDGRFSIPDPVLPKELAPGESYRFSVTWSRPFDDTPGSRLWTRLKAHMSEIDGETWGDLTDSMRRKFEQMARDQEPTE